MILMPVEVDYSIQGGTIEKRVYQRWNHIATKKYIIEDCLERTHFGILGSSREMQDTQGIV